MTGTLHLSSLAVVDNYSTMPTLPQTTTLLGKFITVKSMVCHAVVCLLAIEYSYFLMQQGSCNSWNEALVLSVNKYNASHIQQNVTKAVNVAFQQYGDNVAELCDEILKIITENKMGESTDSDAIVLVAPRQLPYDPPEESGERARFDIELARIVDVDVMPILSSSGTEIGHTCGGQQFVHGLLRLPIPVNTLETVKLPHPDDIRFHVVAGIDLPLVEQTLNLFSAQFWMFRIGDTVEVIAGPFCGEAGYIVTLHERTIVLIMQHDKTSDNIEVSKFVVQTHLNEHILSLGPEGDEHQLPPHLSVDEALPGDIAEVHCGPYAGQRGVIEWIGPDGKVWDKGYNVAVGDTVEVARGPWYPSHGVVKAVDLTKASLDVMCVVDGVQ
ncbi:hypothetical protein EDC04DRAFT_2614535, partial [Pisolithus marmoratus]